MKSPSVTIIILTWNSQNDISDCLSSIDKIDYDGEFNTIVVDNDSTDNTKEIVSRKFPHAELLEMDKNYFFTGGNNRGIKYAIEKYSPEFLLVLNPDTKVESNILESLTRVASSPRVGIVGPKVKFWNNDNEGLINSAGLINDGFKQSYDRGFMEKDKGQYDRIEEVEGVTGACMLLRTEMVNEIGAFWEPLKMYLDDTELCLRAKKNGWKVIYTPETVVGHKWMQSTNQNKLVKQEKWKMRNWLYIAMRHYSIKSKLAMLKHFVVFKLKNLKS